MDLKSKVVSVNNFISLEECREWIKKAPKNGATWDERTITITSDPITQKVQSYWRDYFKDNSLTITQSQIQLWPVNSFSELHIHDTNNREGTLWNSMLYLNDNYLGGEFYTNETVIKPKPGMLTFFNGREVHHGVKPVSWSNRYTLIFWFS